MDPPAWEAEAAWHVETAAVLARLSFFPSVESLISTMRPGLLEDCLQSQSLQSLLSEKTSRRIYLCYQTNQIWNNGVVNQVLLLNS